MEKSSLISGFYKLPLEERLKWVSAFAGLTPEAASMLKAEGGLPLQTAERMIENVVGFMPLPLGVAVNFIINGKPRLVPMALEEPSVVAAASYAAKLAAVRGGFWAEATDPIMIGQMAGEIARENLGYLIPFMAVISVNLAILNLLPVPVLDGGMILFFLIEIVTRKPISIKKREMAQKIGLFLLLMLMAIVFYNDLLRIITK